MAVDMGDCFYHIDVGADCNICPLYRNTNETLPRHSARPGPDSGPASGPNSGHGSEIADSLIRKQERMGHEAFKKVNKSMSAMSMPKIFKS